MSPAKAREQLAARGIDAHVTVGRVFSDLATIHQCCIYLRPGSGRLGAPMAVGTHPSSKAKAVDAAVADAMTWGFVEVSR